MTLEAPTHFPIPSLYSFLSPYTLPALTGFHVWKPSNHASQNSPTETWRDESWAARPPKESDFLTSEMNQRGLTQQVLYWRVGGKTKQNTLKQQPTCTNNRWTSLLGEELLSRWLIALFPFDPPHFQLLALKTSSPRAQTLPFSLMVCLEGDLTDTDVTPIRLRCLLYPGHPTKHQLYHKGTLVIYTTSCPRWAIFQQSLYLHLHRTAEAKAAAP